MHQIVFDTFVLIPSLTFRIRQNKIQINRMMFQTIERQANEKRWQYRGISYELPVSGNLNGGCCENTGDQPGRDEHKDRSL